MQLQDNLEYIHIIDKFLCVEMKTKRIQLLIHQEKLYSTVIEKHRLNQLSTHFFKFFAE